MVFFWDRVDSPDKRTREVTEYTFVAVFLPVVVVISWAFNRLAKRRSSHKKRERDTTT